MEARFQSRKPWQVLKKSELTGASRIRFGNLEKEAGGALAPRNDGYW